jgi:DNA replicative helicase MCM subunit Mcm2 (Cdc46/Mcm family)
MKLAIASTYVRGPGAKPVSVMLIGHPSVGKSTAIRRIRNVKGVYTVDSFTQKSLEGILVAEGFESGEHTVIAISDLNDILCKPTSVSAPALGVMKSLADEGIINRTAGEYTPQGKDSKAAGSGVRFANPVTAGFLAAITVSDLESNYRVMHSGGLLDRPLTVELDATKRERMLMARATVTEHDPRTPVAWKLSHLKPTDIKITKSDTIQLFKWVDNALASSSLFKWCEDGSTRVHVNIGNLARANALLHKREIVTLDDIRAVKRLEALFMRGYMEVEDEEVEVEEVETASTKPKRGRGRPKGSKDLCKRTRRRSPEGYKKS